MSKLRAGIIGLGFIGAADQVSGDALGQQVANLDGTHLEAMLRHPDVELVAGSSRDPGRRERFSARVPTAAVYGDWREMLGSEALEIVSVATYAPWHAEIASACAQAGVRAVYCEKPIATRLNDARQMIAACHSAGTILVVNHNRRFHPQYQRLRDLVAGGGLGELRAAGVRWGSGRLGNVGTHLFDAVQMVTGRRVEAVSASLDPAARPDCRGPQFRDPGGWGTLLLEGGVPVSFQAPDYGMVTPVLELHGTLGEAVLSGTELTLRTAEQRQVWTSPARLPTSMDRALAAVVQSLQLADGRDAPGHVPQHPPEQALQTLEVIVACHASHQHNAAWMTLPLADEFAGWEVRSG